MADEDEDGNFQQILKVQPRGRYGQKFHHYRNWRGEKSFNWQRGHGRRFFNRKNDYTGFVHSTHEGQREGFCQIGSDEVFWPAINIDEGTSCFNNKDSQHHYDCEGFARLRNQQFPNGSILRHGRGQQNFRFPRNRLRGHGRWKTNDCSRHCTRNHIQNQDYYHHGVSCHENAENSQDFNKDSEPPSNYSGKQGQSKFFVHRYGKMVARRGTFRGNFKRMGANFGNKSLTQCVNSNKDNKDTAYGPSSIDLKVNMHDGCKGDGIDLITCSRRSLTANKIAPSTRKKMRKQKASSLIQSPLDAKCASQSPAPFNSEPEKECTLLQEEEAIIDIDQKHQETNCEEGATCLREEAEANKNFEMHQAQESKKEQNFLREGNVTFNVESRHQERAFISCIGGSNRKRRRSAAVRDFPVMCSSLQISVVKKAKTVSKERKAARDLVVGNPVGEVDYLSNLQVMNENSSISEVHVELGQVDTKDSLGDCSRTHVTERDGFGALVETGGELMSEISSTAACFEGDTLTKLVQVTPESDIKMKTTLSKEIGRGDLIQASLEGNCENCNKPISEEKEGVLEFSQAVPEGKVGDHTETNEIIKNCSAEPAQSDLQVSNNECNEKAETVGQISCNGQGASQSTSHLAFESSQMSTPPQVPALVTSTYIHVTSKGDNHSIVKSKKKKTIVNRKAELEPSDGPRKKRVHHSKAETLATEMVDTSIGLLNRGHVSKRLKVPDVSETTKSSGTLVPYQNSKIGGSMKNKEPGRRLLHKGRTRVKHFQTSKTLDSLMQNNPAKESSVEATEASAHSLVKRTLHEFESVRKSLVKSQDAVRRADLDAASLLKERGKWRNCEEKIVGEVPGVEVGDQFSFRMEMLIIGLHRQVQSGIDYIPGTKRKNGAPLATSIVASGGYEDDKDDGNTLIYSGQGGNNNKGNKKQESNQSLVRGNLALSNSMKEGTPVRVIRGITDLTSPSSKIYTYDGLYDVIDLRFECGATGYGVYHFTLTRRVGQPQVGLSFLSNLKKKGLVRPNLLLDDISGGQERLPVCVVNEVDEETTPLNFTYIPKRKHPMWYAPLLPKGCNCVGVCDEETCSCAVRNGNELPYNGKGYIIRDKTVVYECGISCRCSSFCQNRVSQKGLRYRLEIFKTKNRGWGVRSLDPVQPGGFICEYTGELLTDAEAEQKVENDEYLFDLGNDCNPSHDELDLANMNESITVVPAAEDVAYTIDAKDLGNVARFINHSCSPNLYAQNVLYDSDDLRFPHVMLFAMENIPPMRELTYDYNYSLDKVRDAYGNVKTKACYCGAQDCQGRLY